MGEKLFFGGLDMLDSRVVSPTKMPRTAIIPVIRDPKTHYLNAGAYSGGIASIKPLHILFGPKSKSTIEAFSQLEEFTVAVPNKHQIDHMWVTGLGVPAGINEIELANWNTLTSKWVETPGIAECPLNLECRKIFYEKLPEPWRAIVVGEVVGVTVDNRLLDLPRSDVIREFPMHESSVHPNTGLYGPSIMSGDLVDSPNGRHIQLESKTITRETGEAGKTRVGSEDLYASVNKRVYMNAIFPCPTYFFVTTNENGSTDVLPIIGGKLQSTKPALDIPIPIDSKAYRNLKRTGEFVIGIPHRGLISAFEEIECGSDLSNAGLTLIKENMVNVKGIRECYCNMDGKAVVIKEVPGTDYVILIGRKVGVSYERSIFEDFTAGWPNVEALVGLNEYYSSFPYVVMDESENHLIRKWGFHNPEPLSVRGLPTWGTRYGTSWTGPRYFSYWLIELVQEGLILPRDLDRIATQLMLWNDGEGQKHLAEYYGDQIRKEIRERLTTLFKMMAWAHRDYHKWREVQGYISSHFPEAVRDPFDGPYVQEIWNGEKILCMSLLGAMLK